MRFADIQCWYHAAVTNMMFGADSDLWEPDIGFANRRNCGISPWTSGTAMIIPVSFRLLDGPAAPKTQKLSNL
jgi:hypothetical protein